ncbi:MAG: PilZ domain-containing protein [Betaproteobacteria bacterium]|nr:PilZ domain-containing protein [Betaproteobacteria bacterium]
MNTVQRRRYSRIRFCSSATFQAGLGQWPCEVFDLSLRGALITGAIPDIVIGTSCLLELRLDDDICVRMEGHVAHHCANHTGIACDVTDLDSVSHLRRLLALNLGDASLIEREFSVMLAEHEHG